MLFGRWKRKSVKDTSGINNFRVAGLGRGGTLLPDVLGTSHSILEKNGGPPAGVENHVRKGLGVVVAKKHLRKKGCSFEPGDRAPRKSFKENQGVTYWRTLFLSEQGGQLFNSQTPAKMDIPGGVFLARLKKSSTG